MKRRQEREFALKILYAAEMNEDRWEDQLERLADTEKKHSTDFSKQLINGSIEHKTKIDEEIVSRLKNWEFSRVAIMDKLILRLAITEFLYFEEIPPEVTMNEAIELGKIYSTNRSGKFINGILDAVFKKLKKENRITKTGRGLVSRINQ